MSERSVPTTEDVPREIDGFRVLRPIGGGPTSRVYQAVEPGPEGRLVALKVRSPLEERLSERSAPDIHPYRREAAISRMVRHPGLVRILRTGELDDGRFYAAMEYVEGMTIDEELRHRGRIPWREAVAVTRRLAEAVSALHEVEVVHRDLTPSNVMVRGGRDGKVRVKLIDFGLARYGHERDDERAGVPAGSVGTPRYLAPEQARGEGSSYITDVYAVGAILYEMLTGRPALALRHPSGEACLAYLTSDRAVPVVPVAEIEPAVPAPIQRLVARTVSRDPTARPADAWQLAEAVEAARVRAEASDGPPRDGSPVRRFFRWLRGGDRAGARRGR